MKVRIRDLHTTCKIVGTRSLVLCYALGNPHSTSHSCLLRNSILSVVHNRVAPVPIWIVSSCNWCHRALSSRPKARFLIDKFPCLVFLFRRHILLIAFNIVAPGLTGRLRSYFNPIVLLLLRLPTTIIVDCNVQIAFTYRIITLFQSGQMSVIVSLSRFHYMRLHRLQDTHLRHVQHSLRHLPAYLCHLCSLCMRLGMGCCLLRRFRSRLNYRQFSSSSNNVDKRSLAMYWKGYMPQS